MALDHLKKHFMSMKYGELVASAQATMEADVDFQSSLVDLSDEDKNQAVSAKQEELINSELEVLETKATKSEEIARNQRIRAEKAEAEAKKPKEVAPKNEILSKKEQVLEARALNAIHEEDIEEVMAIAEAKKISLLEAVKSPYVKAFIQTRTEERKTAAAVNTGSSRKSNVKSDGEALLNKVDKMELSPEEMKDGAKAIIASVFGK